jgi:hypothetical protein
MAVDTRSAPARFDPGAFDQFRFTTRELDERGRVTLRYALDDQIEFVEIFELPLANPEQTLSDAERERVDGLLALLHWVAGVSYYKTALPPEVEFASGTHPLPATTALLEALYSEGLAELAYTNALPSLSRPRFNGGASATRPDTAVATIAQPSATPHRRRTADRANRRGRWSAASNCAAHARPGATRSERGGRDQRPCADHGDRDMRGAADGGVERL